MREDEHVEAITSKPEQETDVIKEISSFTQTQKHSNQTQQPKKKPSHHGR